MTIPTALLKQAVAADSTRRWWSEVRTNRRAQLGLTFIAILIAGYGLSLLHGANARVDARYRQDAQVLARIAAAEAERDWPQRAKDSAAQLTELRSRLWPAESEGIAQANLQAWIGNLGQEIGLPMLDIRVESAKLKDFPPNLRQITGTITAQPSETAVITLLERLEQTPYLTVISRLHVRQQSNPILELVLVGYARIAASGQGGER